MNEDSAYTLIDEAELRAALRPFRPDRTMFEAGIRSQLESKLRLQPSEDSSDHVLESSSWLRIAAAVIPLQLLGKGALAKGAGVGLAKLSLGQKLIAVLALPAVSLMLMVAATLWAFFKVRLAHRGKLSAEADAARIDVVTAQWWKQFGMLTVGIAAVSVLLLLAGYAIPVYLIFLVSGFFMVSLLTRLGREQLIDRTTIAGMLAPSLMCLAQLAGVSTLSPGYPYLDQRLLQAIVLVGGGIVLMLGFRPGLGLRALTLTSRMLVAIPLLLLVGWFTSSLWCPVSSQTMKAHVESFDEARFSSASWRAWSVPAKWLQDSGVPLDLVKPRKLLERELALERPNPYILQYAFEAGLIEPDDIAAIPELEKRKQQMLHESYADKGFTSISVESAVVRALVLGKQLDDRERRFLVQRMTLTWQQLKQVERGSVLSELLEITKLLQLLNSPVDVAAERSWVHQILVRYQRLDGRLGARRGGFADYPELDFSDSYATAVAIELMQIYGVPEGLRIDALRSFLRPSVGDRWRRMLDQSCMRVASLQRLESLPGVPPITLRDFFRHEQSLIMAGLLVCLCIYATLAAPRRQ